MLFDELTDPRHDLVGWHESSGARVDLGAPATDLGLPQTSDFCALLVGEVGVSFELERLQVLGGVSHDDKDTELRGAPLPAYRCGGPMIGAWTLVP